MFTIFPARAFFRPGLASPASPDRTVRRPPIGGFKTSVVAALSLALRGFQTADPDSGSKEICDLRCTPASYTALNAVLSSRTRRFLRPEALTHRRLSIIVVCSRLTLRSSAMCCVLASALLAFLSMII